MLSEIILSAKPMWADKILSGEKTIELRRRFIRPSGQIITAHVYSSSPVRALVGSVTIENILIGQPVEMWRQVLTGACVSEEKFRAYFDGADEAIALVLTKPIHRRYPIPLAELRSSCSFSPPMSWRWAKPAELDLLKGHG